MKSWEPSRVTTTFRPSRRRASSSRCSALSRSQSEYPYSSSSSSTSTRKSSATSETLPTHPRRSGFAVRLVPGDDGVPKHTDPVDLGLHHVAWSEIQRLRVLGEAGDPRHGSGREHVSGRVAERGVVAEDLRDRDGHPAGVRDL